MLALLARLKLLGFAPHEVEEQFVRSSGNGGQNVNKVSTCVQLTHRPTGVRVRAEESRSQSANRDAAWLRLIEKLEARSLEKRKVAQEAREKVRRQKRPRPWGLKQKILRTKKHRATNKQQRRRAGSDD